MANKIHQIEKFTQHYLTQDGCSAHNMEHVRRVYNLAMHLAEGKKIDLEVIQAAVLLHDIGKVKEARDRSGKIDHAIESAKLAAPFLKKLGYAQEKINHITECIISHRYRTDHKPNSLEAKIVFDADKLETVGAIGLARAFVWTGKNNAHIYKKANIKKYARENLGGKINGRIQDKSQHSPQINWETKDKFIVDYLYTAEAKKIARQRIKFSKLFFKKLEREIQGKE